jgi:hypothetical protein
MFEYHVIHLHNTDAQHLSGTLNRWAADGWILDKFQAYPQTHKVDDTYVVGTFWVLRREVKEQNQA